MTKAELVEDVARAAELTKKDAERLVEIVFESIIDTLNQGEKIELRGFGSFRVRERGARRGRNPKTGDPVDIPAKRVPYFKPGKELKELINEDENGAGGAEGAGPAGVAPPDPPDPDASEATNPPQSDVEPSTGGTAESGAADSGEDGGEPTQTPLM
jgi:integration host factor subunit beta